MTKDAKPVAIGIDLGTTYSCIAYIDEYGKPVILKNFEGEALTPSVVYFTELQEEIVVGREAKKYKNLEPDRVVDYVKRSMGKPNAEWMIGDKSYRPEEISAYILKKLIRDAEQALGRPVDQAVITCPAYFGIAEREATAQAGIIAGINGYTHDGKPNIIPEPTAAAFYYGLEKSAADEVVLVFDLGGGTFDVTLLAVNEGSVEAICIGGEHELGGKDWDDSLTNFCIERARSEGVDLETIYNDPFALGDLALTVEEAKKSLTAKDQTVFGLTLGAARLRVELDRSEFEQLTQAHLERAMSLCHAMLRDAENKGVTSFDRILLVGGSTKMPQVVQRLESEFPGIPIDYADPDEAVAKGAALYAQKLQIDNMISGELFNLAGIDILEDAKKADPGTVAQAQQAVADSMGLPREKIEQLANTTLKNITSKSFGVVVIRGEQDEEIISNLIVKNSALPLRISKEYHTSMHHQTAAELRIMENLSTDDLVDLSAGIEIGNAVLQLRPELPEGSPLEITFELDPSGLLRFHGKDKSSDNTIEGALETTALMSNSELAEAQARSKAITIS